MANFETQKQLKSYEINVEVLEKLEDYILSDGLLSKLELDKEEAHRSYKIILEYERESIKLETVEEFSSTTFEDTLRYITLSLGYGDLRITFGVKQRSNYIKIDVPGKSKNEAKQRGNAIYNDIKDRLRGQESRLTTFLYSRWLDLPLFFTGGGLVSLFIISLFLIDVNNQEVHAPPWLINYFLAVGALAVSSGIIWLLRKFHPYAWLKSNKTERLKTVDKWLFRGIPISVIGSLIFWILVK